MLDRHCWWKVDRLDVSIHRTSWSSHTGIRAVLFPQAEMDKSSTYRTLCVDSAIHRRSDIVIVNRVTILKYVLSEYDRTSTAVALDPYDG